jgi:hypothetical protein
LNGAFFKGDAIVASWCASTEQFRRVPSSAESVQFTAAAHARRRTRLYFLQQMRSVA